MNDPIPCRVFLLNALCLLVMASALLVVHFACGPLSGHVPYEKTFYGGNHVRNR